MKWFNDMHVGIEVAECWIRSARAVGMPRVVHSITDRYDSKKLATRLSVDFQDGGALVGQPISPVNSSGGCLDRYCDFRDRLNASGIASEKMHPPGWTYSGLLAVCLRHVQRNLQALAEGTWSSATLTAPVGHSQNYTRNLLLAARLAEIPEVTIVDEPIANWWYLARKQSTFEPSVVIDVGDDSASLTVIDVNGGLPHIAASTSWNSVGMRHAIKNLADNLAESMVNFQPQATFDMNRLAEDVLQQLLFRGIDILDARQFANRQHWLLQGDIRELLLTPGAINKVLISLEQSLLNQINSTDLKQTLSDRDVRQIILTGHAPRLAALVNWIEQDFPRARIHGNAGQSTWMHSFGAALISPDHPAWNPKLNDAHADMNSECDWGIKIWNAEMNAEDLDVLIPARSSFPLTVERVYRPRLTGNVPFVLELASRDLRQSKLVTRSRWEIPLNANVSAPEIKMTVNVTSPMRCDIRLSGDILPGAETSLTCDLSIADERQYYDEQKRLLDELEFIEA